MDGLTTTELQALRILVTGGVGPLCPNCGQREQDPRTDTGWCVRCDIRRQRELEKKRRWWHNNRGTGVYQDEM